MVYREISNSDDVIDSRDVIARIEELEGELADLEDEVNEAEGEEEVKDAEGSLETWKDDYGDELKALLALVDEASGSPDLRYGETLIRDTYFAAYARELAEDIGAMPDTNHWPLNCIDWEQAARELQQDYMSVDYGGVTFWIRA